MVARIPNFGSRCKKCVCINISYVITRHKLKIILEVTLLFLTFLPRSLLGVMLCLQPRLIKLRLGNVKYLRHIKTSACKVLLFKIHKYFMSGVHNVLKD